MFRAITAIKKVFSGVLLASVTFLGYLNYANTSVGTVKSGVENFEFINQSGAGLLSWISEPEKVLPNDIAEKQTWTISRQESCDFQPNNWKGGSGFLERESDSNRYSMAPNVYSSTIQYDSSISSYSTTDFVFTPESETMGITMLYHELFEIVVGDGDVYGTSFKANLGNSAMERIGDRLIASGGIKMNTDVTLSVRLAPKPDGTFEVIIRIDYTRKDGERNFILDSRTFPIPAEFTGTGKPIRVSVGLSNVNMANKTRSQAVFKCFQVSGKTREQQLSMTYKKT